MTLLCRVTALPDPQFTTPRVLGVDDFTNRRRHSYRNAMQQQRRMCEPSFP